MHTNLISGVLKGVWGVEPDFSNNDPVDGRKFGTPAAMPKDFIVKKGLGVDAVTAEYQICLKCHSNYGYDDKGTPDNAQPAAGSNAQNDRPPTGGAGLTPYVALATDAKTTSGQTNSFLNYTNQAMEFQAPSAHRGNATGGNGVDGGACKDGSSTPCATYKNGYAQDFDTNNHRSWHPVIMPTGRTAAIRGISGPGAWRDPWRHLGDQTMYCTDCHGSDNGANTNVVPLATSVWGPHGSDRNFLLKGEWSGSSQDGSTGNNFLCFKCHTSSIYDGGSDKSTATAFEDGGDKDNLHAYHSNKAGGNYKCLACHVAVPHGWKNRSFLVNLNDIGPEVMCRTVDNDSTSTGYNVKTPTGVNCEVGKPIPAGSVVMARPPYTNPPYYVNARLRIDFFPGEKDAWFAGSCAGQSGMTSDMC